MTTGEHADIFLAYYNRMTPEERSVIRQAVARNDYVHYTQGTSAQMESDRQLKETVEGIIKKILKHDVTNIETTISNIQNRSKERKLNEVGR